MSKPDEGDSIQHVYIPGWRPFYWCCSSVGKIGQVNIRGGDRHIGFEIVSLGRGEGFFSFGKTNRQLSEFFCRHRRSPPGRTSCH